MRQPVCPNGREDFRVPRGRIQHNNCKRGARGGNDAMQRAVGEPAQHGDVKDRDLTLYPEQGGHVPAGQFRAEWRPVATPVHGPPFIGEDCPIDGEALVITACDSHHIALGVRRRRPRGLRGAGERQQRRRT